MVLVNTFIFFANATKVFLPALYAVVSLRPCARKTFLWDLLVRLRLNFAMSLYCKNISTYILLDHYILVILHSIAALSNSVVSKYHSNGWLLLVNTTTFVLIHVKPPLTDNLKGYWLVSFLKMSSAGTAPSSTSLKTIMSVNWHPSNHFPVLSGASTHLSKLYCSSNQQLFPVPGGPDFEKKPGV